MTLEELKNDANFYPFEIPAAVLAYANNKIATNNTYCSYVHLIGDTVVIRTFAFRCRKSNHYNLEITEVERKTHETEWAVRKNLYFTQMGGYHPVYEPKACGKSTYYGYYFHHFEEEDFGVWKTEKCINVATHLINPERIFDVERYKYCGYSGKQDLCDYLRLYDEDPRVEFFGKLGIKVSKSLIKQCKDKQFCRFLKDHGEEVNHYGPSTITYAYKNHMDLKAAEDELSFKRKAQRELNHLYQIQETDIDKVKLYKWLLENNIRVWLYADYFRAISVLGYDLHDTKNLYPKNFMRMHDLRIDEYKSHQAKLKAKEKRAFDKKFKEAAGLYSEYALKGDRYSVVIPTKPRDLVVEGNKLHHCVGKMGYDQKMIEGKCLIVFIRKNKEIDKPYVTVEYLLKDKRISQIYGHHDSKPAQGVIDFANQWAEALTEGLRQQNRRNKWQIVVVE